MHAYEHVCVSVYVCGRIYMNVHMGVYMNVLCLCINECICARMCV